MVTTLTNDNESVLLKELVLNLRKFIEEFYITNITTPSPLEVTPMIPGRYHEEFRNAWAEVRGKFDDVVKAIDSKDYQLDGAGLTGAQLRLKSRYCKDAFDRAKDWSTKEKMNEKPKDPRWYRKWFSYCKQFLQSSNIVISSISSSIPFAAEPIKEFVDGLIFLSEIGLDLDKEI